MKHRKKFAAAVLIACLGLTSCTDTVAVERIRKLEIEKKELSDKLGETGKRQQKEEEDNVILRKQIQHIQQVQETVEKQKQELEETNSNLRGQIQNAERTAIKQKLDLEKQVEELREQIKKTELVKKQVEETKTLEQWNAKIDQILIKLDRVREEQMAFRSARLKTELTAEETRLKEIAREQESQARSLVYELKAQKFPKAEELDRMVKEFISDYVFFISYSRMEWESMARLGEVSESVLKERQKFQTGYYEKLTSIKALKHP